MAENLYNTKFIVANMTEIVANDNQLHVNCIVTIANDKISSNVW
jgi:hypothetical protein